METFIIACQQKVSTTTFAALMEATGAHPTSGVSSYCLKRNNTAVYISLESDSELDRDTLDRLQRKLTWTPRSVILVTVSRRQGSVFLAFEVATTIAEQWEGVIDWAGLYQWEEWFQSWQQAHRDKES
jgi:hypothetical protein